VYNFNVITTAVFRFRNEIKILQLWQTPFIYDTDIVCNILQFNNINVIFVKYSKINQHDLLGWSCCQKFEMMTLDLLKQKSIGFDTVSRTITVPSFMLFRSGVFFYHANIHTHTHIHTHTVTKWLQYLCRHTMSWANNEQINATINTACQWLVIS